MKKILAFGASSSSNSINKKLANYAASQIVGAEINLIDLNDYEMPIFSVDKEKATGIPNAATQFKAQIKAADGIIISFAEHNGSYATAYKNILDWASREEGSVWMEKTMFLLASSPGGRGGKTVLSQATDYIPRMKGNVVASFSLPNFYTNFDDTKGIIDKDLYKAFHQQLSIFEEYLK